MSNSFRLLFVDDELTRWEVLSRALHAKEDTSAFCAWAQSAEQAIDFLRDSMEFTVVALDHDMPKDCGCVVVKWLVRHASEFKNTQFLIHSWNAEAASKMGAALSEAGLKVKIKPFHINDLLEAPKSVQVQSEPETSEDILYYPY